MYACLAAISLVRLIPHSLCPQATKSAGGEYFNDGAHGDFSCNVLMSPSPQGANILGTITFNKKAKQCKNVAQVDTRMAVGWKILQDDFLKTVLQKMPSLRVITPFLFDISCC